MNLDLEYLLTLFDEGDEVFEAYVLSLSDAERSILVEELGALSAMAKEWKETLMAEARRRGLAWPPHEEG